jgi:hypothetical protein
MNNTSELIDGLKSDQRGQVFLLNLADTIDLGLIDSTILKNPLEDFVALEQSRLLASSPAADSEHLADRLGKYLVTTGSWKTGQNPNMDEHGCRRAPILSRVVTYDSFYKYVMGRLNAPGLPDAPLPLDLTTNEHEILPTMEPAVKKLIDSGEWRKRNASPIVQFKTNIVWLAPNSCIQSKLASPALSPNLANNHRDLIGLHWVKRGRCLIRLDINLSHSPELASADKWRPHGAGNGGYRFRVTYDGRKKSCGWGRTVDMSTIAKKSKGHLDGVPEMVTVGFSVPKEHVSASYLGCVDAPPEEEHDFFIERLLAGRDINKVVIKLKGIFK